MPRMKEPGELLACVLRHRPNAERRLLTGPAGPGRKPEYELLPLRTPPSPEGPPESEDRGAVRSRAWKRGEFQAIDPDPRLHVQEPVRAAGNPPFARPESPGQRTAAPHDQGKQRNAGAMADLEVFAAPRSRPRLRYGASR